MITGQSSDLIFGNSISCELGLGPFSFRKGFKVSVLIRKNSVLLFYGLETHSTEEYCFPEADWFFIISSAAVKYESGAGALPAQREMAGKDGFGFDRFRASPPRSTEVSEAAVAAAALTQTRAVSLNRLSGLVWRPIPKA